jgi:phosphinothricin acetyltransferase
MTPQDWPAVRAIYLEGIATGVATFADSAPEWEEWDREHLAGCRLVVRSGGEVKGWAALSLVSRRAVYRGVAEVSIYVAERARRQGVGRLLLSTLIHHSEEAGIWTLQAGIFPENTPSIELHKQAGFRILSVREKIGRLNGEWRDVILMERRSTTAGV